MNLIHVNERRMPNSKIWEKAFSFRYRPIIKIFIAMKIMFLILAISLQVSAGPKAFAQRITLSVKDAPLRDVMQSIRKQSGYSFFFKSELLKDVKPVTIILNQIPIEETLQKIFQDQPINYEIQGKTILLSPQTDKKKEEESLALQPQKNIHGRVIDSLSRPVAKATVLIKGEKNRITITDEKGEFNIPNGPDKGILLVRCIGFGTIEVPYDVANDIFIRLKTVTSPLDEIQVIAYGITSQRLTTGNIAAVQASDIEKQPVSNPLLALEGRVPGLTITQSTGLPGSGIVVRIQGQNSIGKGNDPYYIIDGVPYSSQMLPTISDILGSSGNTSPMPSGSGNPLSYINPADIESIEVLKDADATAIYGSRAANGAILITTKKGKAGKTEVQVTSQSGVGQVTRNMSLLNTKQYLDMRKEAYTNDHKTVPTSFSAKDASNYDLTVWDQNRSTNWQKELIGGKAKYTDVQASITGGTTLTSFRINTGYHRETTVFPDDFSDVKGSFGINLNHVSLNQKLRVQVSANYLVDNNRLPGLDLTTTALILSPNAPTIYTKNGDLNWERIILPGATDSISTWTNPLAALKSSYQNKVNNLIGNTLISLNIVRGLDLKTSLGYTSQTSDDIITGPFSAIAPETRPYNSRFARYGHAYINSWIIEPQLTYSFVIGKGRADVLVGTTFQENSNSLQQLAGTGYNSDAVLKDFQSASSLTSAGSVQSQYKYSATYSKVNYNFDDKYIVNFTVRRDGSSRFGPENRFHTFGALGAAWIFSDETFIKETFHILSFGKLKGSYGTTGNDQIGDYKYISQYESLSVENPYQGYNGLSPISHSNPYLQWELTKKLQGGIELGFLQDRVLLNVNYYRNRSSNQLLDYALPIMTGFDFVTRNFPATVENSGWEFSFKTKNINRKTFTWSSSFNLTVPRNKLIDFPNLTASTYASGLIIGEPINIRKVFNFAGVNPQTGLFQYYTSKGEISPNPNFSTDNTFIFRPSPMYYAGFENSITFKSFQLDFLFQGIKQSGLNFPIAKVNRIGSAVNQPVTVLQRWQKEGDQTPIQKFSTNLRVGAAPNSSLVYKDASFIRFKNFSFSWQVPQKWKQVAHLDKARLFIQGQNLFTITKYQGLDPENQSYTSLPPLKIWTFGIQIGL